MAGLIKRFWTVIKALKKLGIMLGIIMLGVIMQGVIMLSFLC
jgi:hypothetical protein